jgi:alkylated DNA repair protein alkB family protein 6
MDKKMHNAIDFRELRRQERQRIRSSRQHGSKGCSLIGGEDVGRVTNTNIKSSASTASNESADPYESLLRHGQIVGEVYRIACSRKIIDSVFYAQKFLSSTQEREVMTWLGLIPEYSQHGCRDGIKKDEREESVKHNGKWTRLKHARRKVALFDGTICDLPLILQRLSNTLVAIGAFSSTRPPNHVLINEYQPGEGIMPHTDGPAYENRTATISLGGSDVIFKLWPRKQLNDAVTLQTESSLQQVDPSLEVILHGHGSLVLFTDDAYLYHCHEISEGVLEERTCSSGVLVKRGYRVSLTFRRKK